jgi:hypothetical protein
MRLLLIFCTMLFVALVHAEEPKPIGVVVKEIVGDKDGGFNQNDSLVRACDIVVNRGKRIEVYNFAGELLKQIPAVGPVWKYLGLTNGDLLVIFLVEQGKDQHGLLKRYDPNFKVKWELNLRGFSRGLLELQDGSLLLDVQRNVPEFQTKYVSQVSADGKILAEKLLPKGIDLFRPLFQFKNGHVFISGDQQSIILNSKLEIVKELKNSDPQDAFHAVGLKGLDQVAIFDAGYLRLVNGDGKVLAEVKKDKKFLDAVDLPGNKIAAINFDGFLYFYDGSLTQLATHFHESDYASAVHRLSDSSVVYRNATQLVVVDLSGKELGALSISDSTTVGYTAVGTNGIAVAEFLNGSYGKINIVKLTP